MKPNPKPPPDDGRAKVVFNQPPPLVPETPPDRLYVVFCRVSELADLTIEQLGSAQKVLLDAAAAAQAKAPQEVYAVRPSVYGRKLVVRNPVPALDAATEVRNGCASLGVRLAIGVTVGKLEKVPDLGGGSLTGPVVSLAARLAALENAKEKILVWPRVHEAAVQHGRYRRDRFTGPHQGRVKRTDLEYHLLLDSTPTIGNLPPFDEYLAFDAHIVVFDLARFSERDADTQWRLVTDLHRQVVQILGRVGGEARARAGRLWYAPAGDGGVLVFSPEEQGGACAFEFARALTEAASRVGLELRVGIHTGAVTVLEGQLPVGTGILRADAICGYPANGQIAVSQAFWEGLDEGTRRAWAFTRAADDASAYLLTRQATQATPALTVSSSAHVAGELYRGVLRTIRNILQGNAALGEELLAALKSPEPRERDTARAILDSVMTAGLNETLKLLWRWLRDERARPDAAEIRGLIESLAAAGVKDPQWLVEMRARAGKEPIPVPPISEPCSLELLVGALMNQPTRWKSPAGQGFPEGKGYFPVPSTTDLAAPSDRTESRFKELLKNLMELCDVKPQKDTTANLKVLRERMAGFWDVDQPLYSLFAPDDPLLEAVRGQGDWRLLLLLKQEESQGDVLAEPGRTPVLLREIFAKLRELEPRRST